MRRMMMLGIAAALVSGCAVDTGDEDQAGESEEAFTKNLKTTSISQTDPFTVPLGTVIRVTSKADIADRASCGSTGYAVRLIRFDKSSTGTIHQVREGIDRTYPLNQPHVEAWIGLHGGMYRVEFETQRAKRGCELIGVATVDITPPKP